MTDDFELELNETDDIHFQPFYDTFCQNGTSFWLFMLYPDSGISMDEEIVLGDMIWSYNKAEF